MTPTSNGVQNMMMSDDSSTPAAAPAAVDHHVTTAPNGTKSVEPDKQTSKNYNDLYAHAREHDSSRPSWMNLGYVDDDFSQEQADAILTDLIGSGSGDNYRAVCIALATEMYNSIPLNDDVESGDQSNVLDCGCGCGAQTLLFKELHPNIKYTGFDISAAQVESCKKYTKELNDVTLTTADSTNMSKFTDDSFTNVYALECAFHFDTRHAFLKETARVLKPGGALAAMDAGLDSETLRKKPLMRALEVAQETGFLWFVYLLFNSIYCICRYGRDTWPVNREINVDEYKKSLREAGFTGDTNIKDISSRVFFYHEKMRRRILGLDKSFCERWFSFSAWRNPARFLFIERNANPYMLALQCRADFAPYWLVTAFK